VQLLYQCSPFHEKVTHLKNIHNQYIKNRDIKNMVVR